MRGKFGVRGLAVALWRVIVKMMARNMRDEGNLRKGKAMSKGKVSLGIIVTFFVGVFVGMAIALLGGAILCYIDPGVDLTETPGTFGDIKVWAKEPPDVEGILTELGIHRTLLMTKNKELLLMVTQNEAGENIDLSLFDNTEYPIFKMEFLNTPGKWDNASYAGRNRVGDLFFDIDFDGHFDVKYVMDDNGKIISANIFINDKWQRVNNCRAKDKTAILGETKYIFDANSGWVIHK